VIFHFLNKNFKVQSLLAEIKRIKGVYIKKNITKTVIPIIKKMVNNNRLGFFIKDNASENSTAIRAIITYLYFNEKDLNFKRIRYLDYIINLAVKAFFFKKRRRRIRREILNKKKRVRFKAVRELWRKKELVEKFYNTVSFIRKNL
jgi:hypothetical protein